MSKKFKATNGLIVRPHLVDKGVIIIEHSTWGRTDIKAEEVVALREFFEWEVDHNPWEDAEPGEIWALTVDGFEDAYFRISARRYINFQGTTPHPDKITAGRRIWPENAS